MNRPANAVESMVYEFDNFRIDGSKRHLLDSSGNAIALAPKAFDTLLYLVTNSEKVVEKDELMSAIWPDTVVEENSLNKNISVLRRVLGDDRSNHRFIVTIPGKGYKFVCDVSKVEIENSKVIENGNAHPLDHLSNKRPWFISIAAAAIIVLTLLFGAAIWRSRNRTTVGSGPKSIAILPFRPLVAENGDETIELGMTNTLILRLGNNRGIIVRPLSSVRKFGGLDQDALLAGRELDVDSVLEGNIQRSG